MTVEELIYILQNCEKNYIVAMSGYSLKSVEQTTSFNKPNQSRVELIFDDE